MRTESLKNDKILMIFFTDLIFSIFLYRKTQSVVGQHQEENVNAVENTPIKGYFLTEAKVVAMEFLFSTV